MDKPKYLGTGCMENPSNVTIGDIVTLRDGKCGKVREQIAYGKFMMVSGKEKLVTQFAKYDVVRLTRRQPRRVRIHQIVPGDHEYTFMGYSFVKEKKRAAPPAELYKVVFDGYLGMENLEEIYRIFNVDHPKGYSGRSLSTSDIVELYDAEGSRFFYCDSFRLKKIRFKPVEIRYMLISCVERDINTPLFFTSLEKAQRKMKKELLEQVGSLENYSKGDEYDLGDMSAWANTSANFDWLITPVAVNRKLKIKTLTPKMAHTNNKGGFVNGS